MKHRVSIFIFSVAVVATCFFLSEHPYFYTILISLGLLFFFILSAGVLFMKFNYFLKNKTVLNSNRVLITFDDGPHPTNTPSILDTLAKNKVKAIFFVIGSKLAEHPELAQRIINEGHIIGNHSQDHNPMMSLFSKSRLMKEITLAQNSIEASIKVRPSIFRPPIGYTNPNYAAVLKSLNMKCIGWTLRSYDSVFKTHEKLTKRLVSNTKPGNIVLLHDNLDVTEACLNDYIVQAKSNGIIFASSEDIKNILDD